MIADIIVIAVIALCIFLGYKRGLIKVGVRILSFIAALIVALILYTPISNYIIENTDLVSNIEKTIEEKIYTKEENTEEKSNTQTNENYLKNIEDYIGKYTEEIKENTAVTIARQIAIMIVRIGTWIVLFIVTKIAMLFIKLFADTIAEIPIIKQFNRMRRDNIWYFRRVCNNICITCNFKYGITDDGRK